MKTTWWPMLSVLMLATVPTASALQDDGAALLWAAGEGNAERVKALLLKGVDPNTKDEFGQTALIYATYRGHTAVVLELVNRGADPNATILENVTALMIAARAGHAAVVEVLADHGANLNARSTDGRTALMLAASHGHTEAVNALLERGADTDLEDNSGATAVEHARANGHGNLVGLLERVRAGNRTRLAAVALVAEGEGHARGGRIKQAVDAFAKARVIDSTLQIPAMSLSVLCRHGAIWASGKSVMPICEQVVALAPNHAEVRDARGVALAIGGDVDAAVADFTMFAEDSSSSGKDARAVRRLWIDQLLAGINPFTADVLATLRKRPVSAYGDSDLFLEAELDERPNRLSADPYRTIERARFDSVGVYEGSVVLEWIVDTTGHVEPGSIGAVHSTHSYFEGPAKQGLHNARFTPGRVHGWLVRALVRDTVNFRLRRPEHP